MKYLPNGIQSDSSRLENGLCWSWGRKGAYILWEEPYRGCFHENKGLHAAVRHDRQSWEGNIGYLHKKKVLKPIKRYPWEIFFLPMSRDQSFRCFFSFCFKTAISMAMLIIINMVGQLLLKAKNLLRVSVKM